MRAAVLEALNEPLVVDEVDLEAPRAGEVRVRVHHCGVCHSDLSIVEGKLTSPLPVVLGHEAAGVVSDVGEGVTSLRPGDKVVLTPAPPCGRCYWCVRGEPTLCTNIMALFTSAMPDGRHPISRRGEVVHRGLAMAAWAEEVLTLETGAVKVDDDVPLDVACVIGCAVQTGVGAVINTAQVPEGATVLVMGAGAIGLSVVQGARLAGAATIIVSDPVADRRRVAETMGATHTIDPDHDDPVAAAFDLTGGVGVDYAFEAAGHAPLIEAGIAAVRMGGTTVIVGAPPVDQGITIPGVVGFGATEKKLIGCLLGSVNSIRDIPRLLALWRAGRLDLEALVTHRTDLDGVNDALDTMRHREGIRTVIDLGA